MIFHGLKITMEFPGSIQTYVKIRTTLFDIGIPGCLGRTIKIKWLFGFSQLDRLQTDFTHGHPSLSLHLDSQQQNHMATRLPERINSISQNFPAMYPLVNQHFAMERSTHFSWENPLFQWPFSIAFC